MWLYNQFNLCYRDIEDLLAERGITVSYESARLRSNEFWPHYRRKLNRNHGGYGDTFFIDEVFVKMDGVQDYLWRAVDQDGDVIDVYLQKKRYGKAAKQFFRHLLKSESYGAEEDHYR